MKAGKLKSKIGTKKKKRAGRPPLVVKDKIEKVAFDFAKIKLMAEAGLIDKDFQKVFGIARQTWDSWKKSDEKFAAALHLGKDYADKNVEQSLYKRAMGYQYQEVTRERNKTTGEMQVTKQVIKEVSPDVGACAFWLKNRQPDKWKERSSEPLELPNEEIEALRSLAKQVMANNI